MSKMEYQDCGLSEIIDDLIKNLALFLVFDKEQDKKKSKKSSSKKQDKKSKKTSSKELPLNIFRIEDDWNDDKDAKMLLRQPIFVSRSTLEQMSQWRDYRGRKQNFRKQQWVPIIEDIHSEDSDEEYEEWDDISSQEWNGSMQETDLISVPNIQDLSLSDADESMEWASDLEISINISNEKMEVE